MIAIQGAVAYAGDVAQAPLTRVTLAALFPIFDYVRMDADHFDVTRNLLSTDRQEVDHELAVGDYALAAGNADLIGSRTESIANFLSYTAQANRANDLDFLRFALPVQVESSTHVIATVPFQALYVIRNFGQMSDALYGMRRSAVAFDVATVVPFLENNIFLLNDDTYRSQLSEFKALTGRDDDRVLLSIVTHILDGTTFDPAAPADRRRYSQDVLEGALASVDLQTTGGIIEFFGRHFSELFDFPLRVPVLQPLKIAGHFEVDTPDNVTITKDDLFFYNLSLEYLSHGAGAALVPQVVHYDWNAGNRHITDNTTPFEFDPADLDFVSDVVGPLTITVKAFDGTTLWVKQYEPDDPALKEVLIVVALVRPARLQPPDRDANPNAGKKLRGQVVELSKTCPVKDLTVVIQAKQEGDQLWRVVSTATTDASGNFSAPYPYGRFVAAQALVSLAVNSPADVPIVPGARDNETIADDFLYLLVNDPECPDVGKDDDCDCHAPKKAPRLPGQAELVKFDDYTQDIGGSCVNLSTPNRTLSEHSYHAIVRTSDPDVSNYTLVKHVDSQTFDLSFELKSDLKKIQRAPVDLDNPIRWQDAPDSGDNLTLYQAVTVATGHVLHYRAEFRADGYSLGDLLYSLALAPGQKKQIVVIDSAHALQGAETQNIAQGESLAASLLNERDVADQLGGNISEALRGSSSASTGGVSAGLGGAASMGMFGASLGVAGGYSSSSASASQDSSRGTSMFFGEKLRQAITQNAQSYRQLNATVVTAVREDQQYSVTTDVVANHNHCHALTMMYFEVLRHFAIYQELTNVEECIFVPLLMTEFSKDNIYKWADVLSRSLLPMSSNTYLQAFSFLRYRVKHPLIPAFDANERIKTNYAHVDFPAGAYSDEPITSVSGYMTMRIDIPRPKTVFDRILSFPIVKREEVHNANGGGIFGSIVDLVVGKNMVGSSWEEKVKITNDHILIYDNFQEAQPADVIEVTNFENFFDKGTRDGNLWTAFANLCGYTNVEEFLANYFAHKTISRWQETFNDEIAPRVVEALLENSISISPFGSVDLTPNAKYHGGSYLMRVNLRTNTSLPRKSIPNITVNFAKTIANPADFWAFVTFSLETLNINYTTKHYQGFIVNKYLGDDFGDGIQLIDTPMNSDEQRNPREEDKYLVRKLIEHLNSNVEHYNKALWLDLDPDRRCMLLDGFNIQVFNDFGLPNGSRSLASIVKNELMTVTGNSLVFPVAAGYRVSQSYIAETNQDGQAEKVSLFDHYKPYTPIPPYRISVPSKGVFLEAVQGQCDACEMIKENSSQDWTKFMTDEPTSVLPVTTPVPTITDWKAAFKDFAPPLINIQNAPELPAPGQGTSGLTELLGKAGIFKDITGLDATQQNVIRTYLSNQENAKAFAEMAKGMAMQEHNTQHSDKIMGSVSSAKDSGAISQDDYGKLTRDHLQKQIDGGESQRQQDALQSKRLEPSPIQSAVDLAQTGNRVSASESDADGNMKTLEVGNNPDLQRVGDTYVRPAYTPNELAGIVGEIIATNALKAKGHIVFSDWRKHVSGTGFDFASYDPTDKSLWIVDNKAQFSRGIGDANALTGLAFDSYKAKLQEFLEKTWPNKAEADLALDALKAGRIKKVVSNGFAGDLVRFTKGLFQKDLYAYDVRLDKLYAPAPAAGAAGQAEWEAAHKALTLRKGARVAGKRGMVSVGPMLMVLGTVAAAAFLLKSGEDFKQVAGEIVANVALDVVLSTLPGGFIAGMTLGLESDNQHEIEMGRKVDNLLAMIPDADSLSAADLKTTRAALRELIENPIEVPEPPAPEQPGFFKRNFPEIFGPTPDWA